MFPASTDLPSRKAGPHPTCSHQGCPWCPQVASPRESRSGWIWAEIQGSVSHPMAVLSIVTQAWKEHCLGPPLTETALQVSSPQPSPHPPPVLASPPLSGHFCTKCVHSPPVLRDETTRVSIPAARTRPTQGPRPTNRSLCLPVWPPQRHPVTSNSSLVMNRGGKSCVYHLCYQ